jgi:hypothetical protein
VLNCCVIARITGVDFNRQGPFFGTVALSSVPTLFADAGVILRADEVIQ